MVPAERADLVVAGAGPAGVAAAVTAARAGLRVVVADRAVFPRDKTCGDGLTADALRRLEHLGVDVPALDGFTRVTETVLVSPSGRRVVLPLPADGAHACVVPRAHLDAALVGRARAAGADVREGAAVTAVTAAGAGVRDGGAVRVVLDGAGAVEAPFLVAADGHWSPVRRLLRPGPPDTGEWHAARQYFRGVAGDRLWIVFEPDLLPGYAWVFPLPDGRANVGFGVLRADGRRGRDLRALWPVLCARPALRDALGPHAEPEGPLRAWPIPTRYDPTRLADGRVLFAGDAAGVVDPMTGEGVAQALVTGCLAATAAAGGGPPETVAGRYRRAAHAAIGRDLRFAAALQRILRSPAGARGAVRAAGLTPWTRRNFARWLFEDYPRALVLTPDRWRRGMFTPPGAYSGVRP